jgi:hypothetical protein
LNEEILFVGSAIAGSLLTIAIDKLVKPVFPMGSKNTSASYDSMRTELSTLEFERNLVADSATKVNVAFSEKKIDEYERDKLLQRYTTQIEQYEEKIDKFQNLIDLVDLRNQRDNLTEMVNRRIKSIDQRLKDIQNRFTITYGRGEDERIEHVLEKAVQDAVHNNLHDSKPTDELSQLENSTSHAHDLYKPYVDDRTEVKQLEELHHQIMLELDRLEHDKEKPDEIQADDKIENKFQNSRALNQDGDDSKSPPPSNKEAPSEKKESPSSSPGEGQASQS